jgi:hypothetical protein
MRRRHGYFRTTGWIFELQEHKADTAVAMVDLTDWRLRGQERYLKGVSLLRQAYQRYAPNPSWDHDHCAFCHTKFMVEDLPGVLHEGYCTLDQHRWICTTCFDDFREYFDWKLADTSGVVV